MEEPFQVSHWENAETARCGVTGPWQLQEERLSDWEYNAGGQMLPRDSLILGCLGERGKDRPQLEEMIVQKEVPRTGDWHPISFYPEQAKFPRAVDWPWPPV